MIYKNNIVIKIFQFFEMLFYLLHKIEIIYTICVNCINKSNTNKMNQTPEQQIAVLSNEIDVKNANNQSKQEANNEHICCECGCGVVLEKYKITIGDKKYCGVCGEYAEDSDSDEPKTPC